MTTTDNLRDIFGQVPAETYKRMHDRLYGAILDKAEALDATDAALSLEDTLLHVEQAGRQISTALVARLQSAGTPERFLHLAPRVVADVTLEVIRDLTAALIGEPFLDAAVADVRIDAAIPEYARCTG